MSLYNHTRPRTAESSPFEQIVPAFLSPGHILEHAQNMGHGSSFPIQDIEAIESPAPLFKIDTFTETSFSDLIIREKLFEALERRCHEAFIQPIVSLPQRQHKFYEVYGRLHIKNGLYLTASHYMPFAKEEALSNKLDTLVLLQSLKVLHQNMSRPLSTSALGCFININARTLCDKIFMNCLLDILSRSPPIADKLIFEIPYNELEPLSETALLVLKRLSTIGCRFSLDHVQDFPCNVKKLKAFHISFVKIDARTVIQYSKTDRGFSEILSRKARLEENGISVIIEKIENEPDLLNILDIDFNYAQGYLFGKPDFQSVYTHN